MVGAVHGDQHGLPPTYDPVGETRFAVVMYGGVSLAIYINGVAQELFRLVQATAPAKSGDLHFSDAQLDGSARVYREVGRRLVQGTWRAAMSDSVRTRFVIDILSGTSAGGINAVLLAKALANGEDIGELRSLWIEEGDIARLFNERGNYKGLPGVRFDSPAKSLLIGQRLFRIALDTIRRMGRGTGTDGPTYADELDLAVTTTDLAGLILPIKLADASVHERSHRTVLRFKYSGVQATGDARNDFEDNDVLLAFAARATSSFPFAFEPVVLSDLAEPAGLSIEAIKGQATRLLPDYGRMNVDYERFAFSDGGILDNKPFTHATAALRRRRADVPVQRKVLFIEPDPAREDELPQKPADAPDAVGNVGKAVALPSVESIREDLAALSERNKELKQIREVCWGLERALLAPAGPAAVAGPARLVYLRLRRKQLVTDVAALAARGVGLPEGSDAHEVLELLVDATLRMAEADLPALLDQLDLPFRLRRLNLLQDRINLLLLRDAERFRVDADRILAAAEVGITSDDIGRPEADFLRGCKREINDQFVDLRSAGRGLRTRRELEQPLPPVGSALDPLADWLAGNQDVLHDTLAVPDPGQAAAQLLAGSSALAGSLEELIDTLRSLMAEPFASAETSIHALLADDKSPLATVLRRYYDHFEQLDLALFPLTYPDMQETNPVDVHRVSPLDANNLIKPTRDGPRKLAGNAVYHFGGFLDRAWRRTDILWGRLDGAERILDTVVPDEEDRQLLVNRAHAAILRDELGPETARPELALVLSEKGRKELPAALASSDDERLLKLFRSEYKGPRPLDPVRAMELTGRGVGITGEVLETGARKRHLPSRPAFWLARIGRLLWGFAELLVPGGTTKRGIMRYLPQLALLAVAVLLAAGTLGLDAATASGWLLLAIALVVLAASWVMRALARGGARWLAPIGVILILAVIALAAAEVFRHREEDWEALKDTLPFL